MITRHWTSEQIVTAYETRGIQTIVKESGDTTYYVWKTLREAKVEMRRFSCAYKLPSINISPTEQGYIAGILDGEGSIVEDGGHIVVVIANTDKNLMDWLLRKMGGYIQVTPTGLGKKTCWLWKLSRMADIKIFLETLEPFLIVKKSKARKALEVINNVYRRNGSIS
jgi:hypothetical protein